MSKKQTIRIPKDARMCHQILATIVTGLPAELPLDIEITPSGVKVSRLNSDVWNPLRIKMSWAEVRIEVSLRKYIGADKTSIDSVSIMLLGSMGTRKHQLSKKQMRQLQAEYWTR